MTPYSRQVVKAAHLTIPLACMSFGYTVAGFGGMMVAAIVLGVTHLSSYNDRESWQ